MQDFSGLLGEHLGGTRHAGGPKILNLTLRGVWSLEVLPNRIFLLFLREGDHKAKLFFAGEASHLHLNS